MEDFECETGVESPIYSDFSQKKNDLNVELSRQCFIVLNYLESTLVEKTITINQKAVIKEHFIKLSQLVVDFIGASKMLLDELDRTVVEKWFFETEGLNLPKDDNSIAKGKIEVKESKIVFSEADDCGSIKSFNSFDSDSVSFLDSPNILTNVTKESSPNLESKKREDPEESLKNKSFLGNETNIMFKPNGLCIGATLRALVEHMCTKSRSIQDDYFFITFRDFTTTKELVKVMIDIYWNSSPNAAITETTMTSIQIQVCNLFMLWRNTYWQKEDDPYLQYFEHLVHDTTIVSNEVIYRKYLECLRGIKKEKPIVSRIEPAPIPIFDWDSKKPINLDEEDPEEIARQLSIMEMKNFLQIKISDYLDKNLDKNPNIRRVVEFTDLVFLSY